MRITIIRLSGESAPQARRRRSSTHSPKGEKYDYQTGELLVIHSYYAAGDDELRGLTEYEYRASFGEYREEPDAAQTLSF